MREHFHDLLHHMAWADAMFFHAWSKGPREDAELRERWAHVAGTAGFFLEVLRGEHKLPWDKIHSGEVRPPWLDQPLKSYEELRHWTQEIHGKYAEFGAGLDEEGLNRTVQIPWFPEPPCLITVGQALAQSVLHTQHHRGQCMTRLKAMGGEPKNVDYIIWLWKGRPEARWT